MGLLDGKVAIITGAGGGLGRAHALAFAKEGARIVVNDLGGSRDGTGASTNMADMVVNEIKELGGEAVANYASVSDVEGVQGLVQTALDSWGRLDIVINNAGILRDKTLLKLEDENFDLVMAVHARGTYLVGKYAATAMRELGNGGTIINTSSIAGLKGNFGQTNYACAKAGIYGMTVVWAQELGRFGIRCNAVAPMAKTRMTEDISAVPDDVTPEKISPVFLYLASDLAKDVNGRVFGAHGDHLFEYHMELSPGVRTDGELWTPQTIAEKIDEISQLSKPAAAPSTGEASTEDLVEALFMAMPEGFKADKAAGWNANLQFAVGDTGTYTLIIEDGNCRAVASAEGSPTATVKIDHADTILAIAKGEQDPQQAFMSGKMSADNLGDLMRFSQTFSMRKAGEAAKKILGGASGGGGDAVGDLVSKMTLAFLPENASGWNTTICFDIKGSGSWGLIIKDGSCSVEAGAPSSASCTITYDSADTLGQVISGTLDPQQAFMAGKIQADNMGELAKFARCFDMSKAGTGDAAPASESSAPAGSGMNKDLIGKTYRRPAEFVYREHTEAYARATNDSNAAYLEGDSVIAPILYPVRPLMDVVGDVVMDKSLNCNVLKLLHGEQDMRFLSTISPKDLICSRANILSIEEKSSGELLNVQQRLLRDGEVVCEVISGYFVRGPKKEKKEGESEKKSAPAPQPESRELLFESSYPVDRDQSLRYAEASLDSNPIHVDEGVAQAAGLSGIILHGLCSMAMGGREIVNQACGGDPNRLKRLKVRFSKIVYPGDTLTTRAWIIEKNENITTVGFETVNQDGENVISRALAEIAD